MGESPSKQSLFESIINLWQKQRHTPASDHIFSIQYYMCCVYYLTSNLRSILQGTKQKIKENMLNIETHSLVRIPVLRQLESPKHCSHCVWCWIQNNCIIASVPQLQKKNSWIHTIMQTTIRL